MNPRTHNTGFVGAAFRRFVCAAFFLALTVFSVRAAEPSASDLAFFESKIRPLLAENCFSCHSANAKKLRGGLYLDSREGMLKGGELGPAIVPGDPDKSLVIQAVRYTNDDLQMPKDKPLSKHQIADLTQWVSLGAPWPSTDPALAALPVKAARVVTEQDRQWWAFQPIRPPALPKLNSKARLANPIDAFVRAGLEAKGIKPNPPATRRELIRRAYFDLIGLPPPPEEIAAFERDKSSNAWPRLIDRLLALPQYGERWGRYWLDLARFAQSNGYERDGEKPEAWRYRDYVIKAFNEDKPYDRFIEEQIAGDELEYVTDDSIIATGFQRLGVWDDEPDDKRMAEFDELDDVVSTTGSAFLGLTIGCARCHDHKFDPILQADYYSMLSFFRNLRLNENAVYTLESANYVPLAQPAKIAEWRRSREANIKSLEEKMAAAGDEKQKKELRTQLDQAKKAERPPFDFALAVRERGAVAPATRVLVRGNAGNPGPEVQPAFLTVLGGRRAAVTTPPSGANSTGRRLAFAKWVANPENPLTARVMVNRIWQHHFGRGIVKTPSDFGHAGTPPTNPKLLDFLARQFIDSRWSVKKLHKAIMLSQTYQMSSQEDNAKANSVDPGNDLLWRQNLRRLDAEALRDTILAISGQLNPKMGGRGFFPRLSGEVLAGQSRPGLDWDVSPPDELCRRSIYAYVRRTMPVPMLDVFDYNNTTSSLSERVTTTVAPQSLMLLNDDFMQQQAAAMAQRLERETGARGGAMDDGRFIGRAFQLAIGRDPTKHEQQVARDFIGRQREAFGASRGQLLFRTDVPNSLSVEYMGKLKPEQFLIGPQQGWSYYRGSWSTAYEGIRSMQPGCGPFALVGAGFSNGCVETTLVLHTACESAGILFRASAEKQELLGYEVTIEPRSQRVLLRRHGDSLATLAEASASVPTARDLPLKIEATNGRIRVWLADIADTAKPLIDFTDASPILQSGRVGVRVWGASVGMSGLTIQPAGQSPVIIRNEEAAPPDVRALQAFCLLLLNLNEVVYID